MAHQIRALVNIPMDNGLAEDAITNTFTFDGGDVGATPADVANDAHGLLEAFYAAVSLKFSQEAAALATVKWYNLADAKPRVPILEDTIALGTSGGDGLPHECAVVLSFQADPISGVAQARRRGRVFLGPFGQADADNSGGKVFISPSLVDVIADAAETMMNAGDVDKHWAIYSPTTDAGGASLADSTHDVRRIWVDNAWDTIRSRGQDATLKEIRNHD